MLHGLELLQIKQFTFQQAEEVLCHCIVQAVPFAAHTLPDAFCFEHPLVLLVLVLPALVGVKDQSGSIRYRCKGFGEHCVQGGEYNRFTPEEYRTLITPSDLYVLEHANRYSKRNILHCCGWAGIKNNLEVWKDYPAAVFNWAVYIEGMDLKEGRECFGKPVLG